MSPRVIDDICDYAGELFNTDDIVKVYAIRFKGARSHTDIFNIIARSKVELGQRFPHLIRTKVELYDERIEGTHAYDITLLNKDSVNIPIW